MYGSPDDVINYNIQGKEAYEENPGELSGGVIPMDRMTRATVERVKNRYDSVNVEYGEGVARVTGSEEEIQSFVDELESARSVSNNPDHPNDSIMDEAEIGSGWNVLDPKEGKTV